MGIQVKVPTVGESISEVTIANWLKKDGDVVQVDEVIAELEKRGIKFDRRQSKENLVKLLA